LYDLTSDMKEYIRLGRGLWPLYITPILPNHINTTISTIQKTNSCKGLPSTTVNMESMQRDILSFLDQKIFPQIRYTLQHGLGILSFDSSGINTLDLRNQIKDTDNDLPILVKYLLLAAYICHTNRQDKDRQLFTIERNGKKRRKTKEADIDEETAYGIGSQHDVPKTIRPTTFPMERLYSLYVSIVTLCRSHNSSLYLTDNDSNDIDDNEMFRSLGNVRFLDTITYLRDIGILHDYPKRSVTDPIRYSQRLLWTSITRDEAHRIATSIEFPLDRYIL
jgi:hypothetical protein